MTTDEPVDLQQVRREIEAEVRARRASGEYPAGFEREMDALFARFAPPEVSEDFDAALERAEEAVAVDPVIPTASNNPVFGIVKRVTAKLIGWYHVWIAQQLTGFGAVLTNALRLLGGRVGELERRTAAAGRAREASRRLAPVRDDAVWRSAVLDALKGATGRVAVLECGDGALLAALVDGGIDAYGVEPRADLADDALAHGGEVRVDDVPGHLASVAHGALAGVVLRGVVERTPVGELLELVDASAAALASGGRLVVCSLAREVWGDGATAAEADLVPGRPLRPATWMTVLPEQGFADVNVVATGDAAYVVVATRAAK